MRNGIKQRLVGILEKFLLGLVPLLPCVASLAKTAHFIHQFVSGHLLGRFGASRSLDADFLQVVIRGIQADDEPEPVAEQFHANAAQLEDAAGAHD
jgi:hypothetical protein